MTVWMNELLEEISRDHFPRPRATVEVIEAFEQRVGWRLDADLRAFYLHCDGASLVQSMDSPYEILPLAQIVRARAALFGARNDDDRHGPSDVYALCYVRDGNYVLLDTGRQIEGRHPLMDGFHETWPDPAYSRQIAPSFSAFLREVLRTQRSLYWLGG